MNHIRCCCCDVTNAICLTKSGQGPRNSSQLTARILRLSLALALSTLQMIVRLCSVPPPNLEGENPGGGQGPPMSLPLQPTTREDLRLDGYLEYPHAAKALYIYKHPCFLRDSNPVPTASQSVSLTTIPVGRHIRV
ncbi:uncharacterized protein TNCV_2418611 [Trichonephila clavipes]|nr:uncharacterized protein TNCV_2418611 [Trichonephila clavipes]